MYKNKKIYVAPMMQYTDKHDRYFLRIISKNVILFTEMIPSNAIIHGDTKRFHLKEEESLLTDPSSWYIRSEKETLCRFHKDYSLFTINVLFEPLNKIVDYPDALRGLIKSLETFDEDESI